MNVLRLLSRCVLLGSCVALSFLPGEASAAPPQPAVAEILLLPDSGTDPEQIDYAGLPVLEGAHAVVHSQEDERRFQLHDYLIHHDGKFWCIWSQGPPVEDEPTQEVRYATSDDGLTWSEAKTVTGRPEAPYAFIARGLWVYRGELLALAAHFKGKGAFGADKELALQAYAWDPRSESWRFKAKLYDNAINNFPPQKLPSGEWILTRRDARFNVSVLIGGRKSLSDWQAFPVVQRGEVPRFSPDEPIFWALPDKTLFALYRDNGGSRRLFHSTSADEGRTWTRPVLSNFPNATSKIFSMQTSRGYRVLVSNANPNVGRREMHLSVSRDGRTFTRMARLAIPSPRPATLQYPHVIEHDRALLIAFSRNKKQSEVLRVPLDAVEALLKP